MVRQTLITALLAICAMLSPVQASAQQIETTVDRTELARGETLTYTIRVYDRRQGMQLDLTPLTEEFDVLGTRTSSQIRSVNGAVESWTDYIVTLFPLIEGDLTIPAIQVNESMTDPINVLVRNEGPRSNQGNEELFLELEANKESIYVQEQLLFAIRLYYTINGIRNPQFTELEIPDTVIQLIGSPNQYEKLIDGVRYGVYEKRYVIFPQRSGALEIPDILFRGEVTDGSSNFVFRNLNTRRVTAFTEGVSIEVLERPEVARDSEFWLPLRQLSLEESWEGPVDDLHIGDTLVRTISMRAEGLDGAVLPPLNELVVDRANVYPEPSEIERMFVDGSIVGTRVERKSIVATESGALEIPEIVVPWWNVDADRQEFAIIPATTMEITAVAGATPAEQTVAGAGEDLAELLAAGPAVDQEMIDAQAAADTIEIGENWLNWLLGIVIAVVAASLYLALVQPHHPEIAGFLRERRRRVESHYAPEKNEAVAWRQLRKALAGGDIREIRRCLVGWADHHIDTRRIANMEDILNQREVPELHAFVNPIQATLFNTAATPDATDATDAIDARSLARLAADLRRVKRRRIRKRRKAARYALVPLYRN
ncbi:MAG: protein BatD [Gammaproteobacteria bacterium]|nr:protein BatD [Gammaproteobacteria bacterium]MYH84912.1 protein BatD [Gammaproteobacteria bacterium]MYK03755.1 protein BatD [Gammaproteobacteria bacterium]